MTKIGSLGLLVILVGCSAYAQRWDRNSDEPVRSYLTYKLFSFPGDTTRLPRVDIAYRIDQDFFVGIRPTEFSENHPFVKKGELLVELLDSVKTSVARTIEQITIETDSNESVSGHHQWYQGLASVNVIPGKYRVLVELSDLQSTRRFMERNEEIRVVLSSKPGFSLGSTALIEGRYSATFPDTLTLANFGDDFLFGEPGSLIFQIPDVQDSVPVTASYGITIDDPEATAPILVRRDTAASVIIRHHSELDPIAHAGSPRYYVAPSRYSSVALLPLPIAELNLRNFHIKAIIHKGAQVDSISERMGARWPDMPASLRNVNVALDELRFLISAERINAMKHGTFESRRDSLEAFWKIRDPSPGTAYNEIEAEYYRRIDYAQRAYATLHQQDGTRTDRGKVYILYGPPLSTERTLDPDGTFREVWSYQRPGRKFLFEDHRHSGDYVLVNQATL